MKIKRGSTSVRRLVFIADSSSTTGAGLANLVHNSAGLTGYYFAGDMSNEAVITFVTATLGTYTSEGFVAVDNTNMPGWYEIGIPNAALDGGTEVAIQIRGAANMVPVNIHIELDAVDYQSATNFGLSKFADIETDTQDLQTSMTNLTANLSTVATNVNFILSDTDNIQTRLPAALVGGRIDASVGAMAANVLTASALATDAVTEIKSGLALAADLATLASYVDTEVAAIKAKTDNLPSDPADASDIAAAFIALTAYVDTEVAAIKAVTDKVDGMLVLDGAVYQYTANALELGPSGGGGGSTSVNVLPYTGAVLDRVADTKITVFYDESTPITIAVTDSAGNDVSLTGKTLAFVVENAQREDVYTVANGSITKSGNDATLTLDQTLTANVGQYSWSLRDITTGDVVLVKGVLEVAYAAQVD